MLPGNSAMGKKLDLSKLTDEEAKHIWDVVQRDFDLRKKEEDRLGDLKTKVEKEDTKRELLGQTNALTESHCIRCLQPFKFLVNSKRQCLDCKLFTCKSCSRYNKKECGWVCDPCRMARVLKIGTLEWYHENVRARFKRFGSAKVMRSLFKRLNGEHSFSQNDLREPSEYDTQSISEVNDGYEEQSMDASDGQEYIGARKTKRLLAVCPFDFDLDPDYSVDSRRQSCKASVRGGRRESMLAESDMASVFHQILEERKEDQEEQEFRNQVQLNVNRRISLGAPPRHDDFLFPDTRAPVCRSLSRISQSSGGSGGGKAAQHRGHLPGPEDSDEEDNGLLPLYLSHQRSQSHASQESLNSLAPPPQIDDLNRRMSAIETLLNRLEQKVTPSYEQTHQASNTLASLSPLPQWEDADLEELQLRQKLDEMTGDISDHGLTSDEDEPSRPFSPRGTLRKDSVPSRPSSRLGTQVTAPTEPEPQQANFSNSSLERRWRPLEEGSSASSRGSPALLFELEGKVAQATASVQNTQSEVSNIQNRIAALNASGMSVDKGRTRQSEIPVLSRRLSQDVPTRQVDKFVRNSLYRGSLTQRNPVAKPKKRAMCAKPVMAQGP